MVAQATPQAIPPEKIKVRDVRYPKHFWADNELVDQYLPGIGANAFAVYMVLCRFANNQTGKCDPSITTLMEKLNLSRNTVKRNLKILQSHELIHIEIRKRGKVNYTHEYTLFSIKDKSGVGQQVTEVEHSLTEGGSTDDRGVGQQMTPNKTQEEQDSKNKTHFGETAFRGSPDTAHTEIKSEPVKAEPKQEPLIPLSQPEPSGLDSAVLNVKDDIPPARDLPPVPEGYNVAWSPGYHFYLRHFVKEGQPSAMCGSAISFAKDREYILPEIQCEGCMKAAQGAPSDTPLPPVPEGYEAIYTHIEGWHCWRHYRVRGKKTTLCGRNNGEMRNPDDPLPPYLDTQCPTCAAKLAERQAKAAARAEKAKPKYLQPSDELKDAWAKILHGGKEGMTGHNWNTLVKLWNELKCPDIEASRKFWKYWYKHDWRGIQGQRPTYGQVISLWPTAQNWTNGTPTLDEPEEKKEKPYSFFFDEGGLK